VLLIPAVLLLCLLNPVAAAPSSARRPSQTSLKATFKLPVMVAGKQNGWVLAAKGTLVNVDHVRREVIQINLGGASAWVKRTDTDFDQRLAAFKIATQKLATATAAQDAAFSQKEQAAAADFQKQHDAFDNPLNKGAYDQQRSVVDYFDRFGRRYHIGVFGLRIYD